MVDFKGFAGLITFECCCWKKLLTTKVRCWIAWGTLSCLMINFSFYKFLVVMDGISVNDLFQDFLKAIMGSVLKVSWQLWFACNMRQCFVIKSFKFGNDRLYVTDKGMHCLSWRFCWWSSCPRSSWSIFWTCCVTSFLYPLLTNCSISFLEWLWYSWNVEQIRRIWSACLQGMLCFNEYGCFDFALRKFWWSLGKRVVCSSFCWSI